MRASLWGVAFVVYCTALFVAIVAVALPLVLTRAMAAGLKSKLFRAEKDEYPCR